MYCYEPSQLASAESDERHWRFIHDSITDLNRQLQAFKTAIHISTQEVKEIFESLLDNYNVIQVLSYQESGLRISYDRDKIFKRYFNQENIKWIGFPYAGVKIGRNNRTNWIEEWHETMERPCDNADLSKIQFLYFTSDIQHTDSIFSIKNKSFQPGGEQHANTYLQRFLLERSKQYKQSISKPRASRTGCSRLSS